MGAGADPRKETLMIALGVFLLIVAVLLPKLAVLWGVGIICIVIGVILFVAGQLGHAIGGRQHYY
jgi:membrane-bound ClpP family serine protease